MSKTLYKHTELFHLIFGHNKFYTNQIILLNLFYINYVIIIKTSICIKLLKLSYFINLSFFNLFKINH